MATWDEIRAHLREGFVLQRDEPDWVGLGWKVDLGGKDVMQRQRVEPVSVLGDPGLLIWSDIIDMDRVPPLLALERNMSFEIGAIAISAGLYVLRVVLALDGLEWGRLAKTLEYVATEAARLREDAPPLPVSS